LRLSCSPQRLTGGSKLGTAHQPAGLLQQQQQHSGGARYGSATHLWYEASARTDHHRCVSWHRLALSSLQLTDATMLQQYQRRKHKISIRGYVNRVTAVAFNLSHTYCDMVLGSCYHSFVNECVLSSIKIMNAVAAIAVVGASNVRMISVCNQLTI
jgi:hypothetical protein